MDAEYEWPLTDDVDSLINVIFNCKKELVKMCFSKFGAARIADFDVYASSNLCELLLTHDTASDPPTDIPPNAYSKPVGNFDSFNLFEFKLVDDKNVRVMIKFDTGEGVVKNWYGNIKVIH